MFTVDAVWKVFQTTGSITAYLIYRRFKIQ